MFVKWFLNTDRDNNFHLIMIPTANDIKDLSWFNFDPRAPSFFNQEPSLIEFRSSNTFIFQSRTSLDWILNLKHPHFSIKNHPWCNFDPRAPSFFNQESSLMQFRPFCTPVFQSRTSLDWISNLEHPHFSIKNLSWLNFDPWTPSFFNQGPLLIEFRTSNTLIFQSRTILDAISTLEHPRFSIKDHPWCNFDPRAPSFFNQGPSLMQFRPSSTPVFQSRTSLDWILNLKHPHFSIKNHPWCNSDPQVPSFFNQEPSLMQFCTPNNAIFQSRTILDAISNRKHH